MIPDRWLEPVTMDTALRFAVEQAEDYAERTATTAAKARPKDRAEQAAIRDHYAAVLAQLRTLDPDRALAGLHAAHQHQLAAVRAVAAAELDLERARHDALLARVRKRLEGVEDLYRRQAALNAADRKPARAAAADTAGDATAGALLVITQEWHRTPTTPTPKDT